MEASDAGLTQDTTAADPAAAPAEQPPGATADATTQDAPAAEAAPAEAPAEEQAADQQGNGFLVIVNQWEPGSVVELFRVDSDNVLRAEGGTRVDRRVVDENGEIGFSGLTPGDRFIAAGYTRGRYEEVRCVAHDESEPYELLQPPVQESPVTLGTQGTRVTAVPAAPSDAADELGVGLPDEVSSPLLTGDESEQAVPARADANVSPGDVEGVVQAPANVSPTGEAAQEPAGQSPPSGTTADETAAVTDEQGQPLAAPDAVEGQAPSAEASAPADAPVADAQAQPAGEAPAVAEASPQADEQQQLIAQAEGLGIPDAQSQSPDQLRAAITDKQVTPVV